MPCALKRRPTIAPAIKWSGTCSYCEAEMTLASDEGSWANSTESFEAPCINCTHPDRETVLMVRHPQNPRRV